MLLNTRISVLLLLFLPLVLRGQNAPRNPFASIDRVTQSKEAAFAQFPELRDPNSDLFKLVSEMTAELKAQHPEVFNHPDWPLELAKLASAQLNSQSIRGVAAPPQQPNTSAVPGSNISAGRDFYILALLAIGSALLVLIIFLIIRTNRAGQLTPAIDSVDKSSAPRKTSPWQRAKQRAGAAAKIGGFAGVMASMKASHGHPFEHFGEHMLAATMGAILLGSCVLVIAWLYYLLKA